MIWRPSRLLIRFGLRLALCLLSAAAHTSDCRSPIHSFVAIHPLSKLASSSVAPLRHTQSAARRTNSFVRHLLPLLFVAAKPNSAVRSTHTNAAAMSSDGNTQTATLAAGCFWSVELVYQREPGVLSTEVGYTGGHKAEPTYKETCTGNTGHAEAVQLQYDPSVVSYSRLLDVFFGKHDPTTKDRQGGDVGSQYRSAIFYHNEEQKQEAEQRVAAESKRLGKTVVTEVVPFTKWWPAEEYHQKYLEKGGQCSMKGDKTAIRCYG